MPFFVSLEAMYSSACSKVNFSQDEKIVRTKSNKLDDFKIDKFFNLKVLWFFLLKIQFYKQTQFFIFNLQSNKFTKHAFKQ
jgi:hypothetical protein